jgi:hypothetical protein
MDRLDLLSTRKMAAYLDYNGSCKGQAVPPYTFQKLLIFLRPRPNIAFSPRVKAMESAHGGVGGGLGSPLSGFSPNTETSFLMISPNLLDIFPVFLLVFSPLETADLMLF